MATLKTSEEWSRIFSDYFTIDKEEAHGWSSKNFHFSWIKERITIDEFLSRMKRSTCYWKKNCEEVSIAIEYVIETWS